MCTGLWDSCLGLFAVHIWGDKDTRKVLSTKEKDAWKRAKGRQQNRVDFAPPGSSEPNSGETSEGEDSKDAGLLEKAKPRGVSDKTLDSALELLHLKKKAPKPVPYVATVVAQQEIVTEMQAAEYLQHPHAIYLQEMLIAEACAVPLGVVCVTGVVDKLFPESIFLEDGGIIVQYALVISYRITIDIAALPTEDPKAVAVAFINEKLNGEQTGHRYDYLFTMQACITQLSRLKDAQIQLVKVINTAALTNADDPEVASILALATSKSYKYYGNQNKTTDVSERCTLIQRRKEEEEAQALVKAHVAEQVRLKKADARAEQREKRRKERERELEIKEHSDDDEEEKEDEDGSDSDSDSYIEHKLGLSRVPSGSSPRSGAPTPPVALAGLGMEIMRLQHLINPTVMHAHEDKKF